MNYWNLPREELYWLLDCFAVRYRIFRKSTGHPRKHGASWLAALRKTPIRWVCLPVIINEIRSPLISFSDLVGSPERLQLSAIFTMISATTQLTVMYQQTVVSTRSGCFHSAAYVHSFQSKLKYLNNFRSILLMNVYISSEYPTGSYHEFIAAV